MMDLCNPGLRLSAYPDMVKIGMFESTRSLKLEGNIGGMTALKNEKTDPVYKLFIII